MELLWILCRRLSGTGAFVYEEGFDKICFIVDRDRDSFVLHEKNNQYTYVIDRCTENVFWLYMRNTCFEIWLLLHFNDLISLDSQKLFKNSRVSGSRRYIEQEIRNRMKNDSKSSYDKGGLSNG
ncbi:MAG: RloB domain-containing protein [Bulleidia sp.]